MFDLPFETGLVIYLSLTSLILSLLALLGVTFNKVRRAFQRRRGKLLKYPSLAQSLFRYLTIFLWMAVSAAVLFLAAFVRSYQSFTREQLIAEVRCVPLADEEKSMHLELIEMVDGRQQAPRKFVLKGDQWALEGDILKWDNWLNFAGLHTMFKLTRVRGRYVNINDEINQSPSVYSLVEQEDPRWAWLYRYGHKLRFVNAVYGNTVYTFPSKENIYEIYVSTSGFVARVK